MATDVLGMMDQESNKAATRSGGFVPTFLTLKDKQKALIRPLFNLNQCMVLAMHRLYNQASPKDSINSVCASEVGGECLYCAAAKDNKKLTAGISFFLPIYVYRLAQLSEDGKTWIEVTYKDKDEKEVAVSGLRILELKAFGTINDVLQALRTFYAEDEAHNIMQCDFIIERKGGDQKTTYVTMPKPQKLMDQKTKEAIPTTEAVRQMVLAACPPSGSSNPLQGSSAPATATKAETDESTPDF